MGAWDAGLGKIIVSDVAQRIVIPDVILQMLFAVSPELLRSRFVIT